MPFGKKEVPKKPRVDAAVELGVPGEVIEVDFNSVYRDLFKPALEAAGLQPFRADDEEAAGDILKDMFAELVTADFVLADISILNANVFYELGIRHTVGPRGVVCVHAGWADRPFDVAPQRTFRYDGKLFQAGLAHDEAWKAAVAAEAGRLGETLRKAVAADRSSEGSPVYSNLPNLQPLDASQIGTARFKRYQAQADEWNQRVIAAGRDGRVEDILTLASDVPSPYYRRKLLRQCGDTLLALGRFAQSEKVFTEVCEDLDGEGSIEEFRVKCQLAMLANRRGRTREAEQKLADLAKKKVGDPETLARLGRVFKDMWRAKWGQGKSSGERCQLAWKNRTVAHKSLFTYLDAVMRDLNHYSSGNNVSTLSALLVHLGKKAQRETQLDLPDLDDLRASVRLAATAKLDDEAESIWAHATLGELHLILGESQAALDEYQLASFDSGVTWFHVRSMLEQVQLFQLLSYRPKAVDAVAALLQSRCEELSRPGERYDKVVIGSGHMIDAPDRVQPRFPPEKEAAVRVEIAKHLDKWKIAAGDLAVCGGARGADILFAEECLKRGARVRLLIAKELDAFVEHSVRLPDSDWSDRFYALCEKSEVAIQPERLGPPPEDEKSDDAIGSERLGPPPKDVRYARNNRWIVNTARAEGESSKRIYALIVWDERKSEGRGGAEHFAQLVGPYAGSVVIVNPELVGSPPGLPE